LLLDEPMASMSAAEKGEMTELIRRVRRDLGVTVLIVEHDIPVIRLTPYRLRAATPPSHPYSNRTLGECGVRSPRRGQLPFERKRHPFTHSGLIDGQNDSIIHQYLYVLLAACLDGMH